MLCKVGREAPKQAKEKFWRVVVAATTLGDTLVELQLFEWILFMKSKSNTYGSIIQFSAPLGFPTSLIVRCSICQDLHRLTHILSQGNTIFSIGVEGVITLKSLSLSFGKLPCF